MPRITPKPRETLQAQTAAFVDNSIEDEHFRHQALVTLDRVDVDPEQFIERSYIENELGKNAYNSYVSFLREQGGAKAEAITARKELLKAYEPFAPIVKKLRADSLKDAVFLGTGTSSHAYSFEVDGKSYVMRLPFGHKMAGVQLADDHLMPGFHAKGIPHMEQLVAASYDDDVVISELMPGIAVDKLSAEDIANITDRQLEDLVDTVINARSHGIQLDNGDPSNLLYDSKEGFGAIDYYSKDRAFVPTSFKQDLQAIEESLRELETHALIDRYRNAVSKIVKR